MISQLKQPQCTRTSSCSKARECSARECSHVARECSNHHRNIGEPVFAVASIVLTCCLHFLTLAAASFPRQASDAVSSQRLPRPGWPWQTCQTLKCLTAMPCFVASQCQIHQNVAHQNKSVPPSQKGLRRSWMSKRSPTDHACPGRLSRFCCPN
jgi:hypothetical protein